MRLSEVMTAEPTAARPDTTLGEALDMLEALEVRHLPVVDGEGDLVGILSDRDLRGLSRVDRGDSPTLLERLDSPVGSVMNANPRTLPEDAEVSDAIELLVDNRIGAVPVTATRERRLVGIVSYVDVLRLMRSSVDTY